MGSIDRSALPIGLAGSAWRRWKEIAVKSGGLAATRQLLSALLEFLRDSTPERRHQRYGDADYDWNYRVNTTSATVSWRDRLMGVFHSPYQPTEAELFHQMLEALREQTHIDFRDYAFVDLGSGKGRTLLMASDYPFRRIIGVELLPALHQAAQDNLKRYRGESQKCFALEAICGDATDFSSPHEHLLIYLFNPFPESGLRLTMENLEKSLTGHPRSAYVLYHNPLLEDVLLQCTRFEKIAGTHQYSIYGHEAHPQTPCQSMV
jgi:SAM-dependent methyltransferase